MRFAYKLMDVMSEWHQPPLFAYQSRLYYGAYTAGERNMGVYGTDVDIVGLTRYVLNWFKEKLLFNPLCAKLICENISIYLHFRNFSTIRWDNWLESFLMENKDIFI